VIKTLRRRLPRLGKINLGVVRQEPSKKAYPAEASTLGCAFGILIDFFDKGVLK
jgi:hypothetical protein